MPNNVRRRYPTSRLRSRKIAPKTTATAAPCNSLPMTAHQILRLPDAQRAAILEAAAKQAVADYTNNPELLEFTTKLGGDPILEY